MAAPRGALRAGRRRALRADLLARPPHDRLLLASVAALGALVVCAVFLLPGHARHARGASIPAVTLAVADLRGHALVLLDTATGDTRRIALPGGPHEMVRLADGRLVLSLEQAGALAVVDPATGAVASRDIGGLPHGLALQGGVLTVTDRSRDVLRRFDVSPGGSPAGWLELAPVPAGHWPHVIEPLTGGGLAVANAGDSTLRIGDTLVTASETPETLAVSPADGDVATAGSIGGAVQVFGADGSPRWQRVIGGRPVRVAYAPDGVTLAVSVSADGAVALAAADGSALRVVAVGGAPDGLAFDASGRTLFVGDLAAGRVSAVDVASGAVVATYDAAQTAGALMTLP